MSTALGQWSPHGTSNRPYVQSHTRHQYNAPQQDSRHYTCLTAERSLSHCKVSDQHCSNIYLCSAPITVRLSHGQQIRQQHQLTCRPSSTSALFANRHQLQSQSTDRQRFRQSPLWSQAQQHTCQAQKRLISNTAHSKGLSFYDRRSTLGQSPQNHFDTTCCTRIRSEPHIPNNRYRIEAHLDTWPSTAILHTPMDH